jgi:hypothetical protein
VVLWSNLIPLKNSGFYCAVTNLYLEVIYIVTFTCTILDQATLIEIEGLVRLNRSNDVVLV